MNTLALALGFLVVAFTLVAWSHHIFSALPAASAVKKCCCP